MSFNDTLAGNPSHRHGAMCEVENCFRLRQGKGVLCQRHSLQKRRYGHPLGQPLRFSRSDWMKEQRWAKSYVRSRQEHCERTQEALSYFQKLMDSYTDVGNDKYRAFSELPYDRQVNMWVGAWLESNWVGPDMLLARALEIHRRLSTREIRTYNQQHWNYVWTTAVLKLHKNPVKHSKIDGKYKDNRKWSYVPLLFTRRFGAEMWKALGPFFAKHEDSYSQRVEYNRKHHDSLKRGQRMRRVKAQYLKDPRIKDVRLTPDGGLHSIVYR